MSSLSFEILDEDIEDILDKISKRLEIGISDKESDEERKRIIMKLDRLIDEAKILLNKMEIVSRQALPKFQQKMRSKINKYNHEIQRHMKSMNQHRYSNFNMNQTRSTASRPNDLESDIRRQVLIGTASLERTSESLARSEAVAVETEQLGTEVLGELGVQRETLERTRDRMGDTQEEVSRSRRVLRRIGMNSMWNKILLIVIIILEALILAGLVYWKFFT